MFITLLLFNFNFVKSNLVSIFCAIIILKNKKKFINTNKIAFKRRNKNKKDKKNNKKRNEKPKYYIHVLN